MTEKHTTPNSHHHSYTRFEAALLFGQRVVGLR